MKTKNLLFAIVINLVTLTGFTQTQWTWTWKSPTPTGNSITDIWNFSATEFLAVGIGGLIMKTNDAGASWTLIQSGTSKSLNGIYFIDANIGWICGDEGIILQTINHGSSWQLIETGASHLYNICFPGTNIGYACGADGTIIKTTDGGMNWESKNSGTTSYLSGMFFISETEGFVTGAYKILKTINGGNIWAEKYYHEFTVLECIQPAGASVFAFGRNFNESIPVALKSTDGGSTWDLTNSGLSGNIYAVSVLDANTIWVSGNEGRVFKTTDAGSNWTNKNPNGVISGDFLTTCFTSSTSGIVCGNDGVIYTTSNDGANWTNRQNKITNGNTGFLSFSDAMHGCWVAGEALYRTTDGGGTWTSQASGQIKYLQMFSDGSGIRLLATNVFETTTDHGATWTSNGGSSPQMGLMYFAFINKNVGIYLTWNTISYKTTNGGVSWTQTQRPYIDIPQAVSFPDPNAVWELEWNGAIVRSTDGGTTWSYTSGGTNGHGGTICAISSNVAWIGRDNGKLFRTTDGGNSFTEIDPQVNGNEIRDIVFLTNDSAIVVANNGYYSISADGGNSWTAGNIAGSNLNKIGIASHSNYFLGGDNGTLIQRHKVTAPSAIEDFGFNNTGFLLKQNYPNPFNSKTTIEFELTSKAMVSLIVYDFLGREVKTLFNGDLPYGQHSVEWDARNVSEGIYYYCLKSGTCVVSKKLIILR